MSRFEPITIEFHSWIQVWERSKHLLEFFTTCIWFSSLGNNIMIMYMSWFVMTTFVVPCCDRATDQGQRSIEVMTSWGQLCWRTQIILVIVWLVHHIHCFIGVWKVKPWLKTFETMFCKQRHWEIEKEKCKWNTGTSRQNLSQTLKMIFLDGYTAVSHYCQLNTDKK